MFFVFTKNGSQVDLLFLDVPHPIHLNFEHKKLVIGLFIEDKLVICSSVQKTHSQL